MPQKDKVLAVNDRQAFVLGVALGYAAANLDDVNAAYADESSERLDYKGSRHDPVREDEVAALSAKLGQPYDPAGPPPPPRVDAEVYSDDRRVTAEFDAAAWFAAASYERVEALAACGWGGDYAADVVAEFTADRDPNVATVFTYLALSPRSGNEQVGFECYVEPADAEAWLRANRPGWLDRLRLAPVFHREPPPGDAGKE